MKIGLMCAMQSELAQALRCVRITREEKAAGLTVFEGDVQGLPVAACACGIGKVNAGITAQLLIDRFAVTHVLMAGVAGGIDPRLGVHALAFSQRLAQHDIAPEILTRNRPYARDGWLQGDEGLLSLCRALAARGAFDYPAFFGDMVSGEAFIVQEGRQDIINRWNPLCVDMESAAAAHACCVNGVPFLAIRAMSDTGEESGEEAFNAHEISAAQAAAHAAEALLRALAGELSA